MIEVIIVSLPSHRALDRMAFCEVLVEAQATCGCIDLTVLDVASVGEAWKLHRLVDVSANAVIAVIGPWTTSTHQGYLEEHLANVLRRAWRPDVTLCAIGSCGLLARSALVFGKRAACNPADLAQLRAEFPLVHWDPLASCVHDANFISATGLLAGAEAALAVLSIVDVAGLSERVASRLRIGGRVDPKSGGAPSRALHPALQRAVAAVHREDKRAWTSAALASVACVSERHLQRLFKTEFGCGVLDYVHRCRLDRAARLLESQPRESLGRVAEAAGFTSVQQLRRIWRREYGVAPSAARRASELATFALAPSEPLLGVEAHPGFG